MLVLGIEATAHTFGIGIIDCKKKEILFNEKNQFMNEDGMDLRKLSDFHVANFDSIVKSAKVYLNSIGKDFGDLDLISYSRGPGLGNSLKIGALVAKTLALKYDVKIAGVNHIKAHLEIGKMLTGFEDPMFLYVSGVNTQIIAKDEFGKYKVYGETEDIGLGNLLDSFARLVGLDFPGGPIIEKLAQKSDNFIELPYTVKGMNVSLAGVYSNLKSKVQQGAKTEDLCYSLQETTFAMVMEVVERAMAYTKKKEFVIVGGVAANKRFQVILNDNLRKPVIFPKLQYCSDNAAMIAAYGFYVYNEQSDKSIYQNLDWDPYSRYGANLV